MNTLIINFLNSIDHKSLNEDTDQMVFEFLNDLATEDRTTTLQDGLSNIIEELDSDDTYEFTHKDTLTFLAKTI